MNRRNYLELEGEQIAIDGVLNYAQDIAGDLEVLELDNGELDQDIDDALEYVMDLALEPPNDIIDRDIDDALDEIEQFANEVVYQDRDVNQDTDIALDTILGMVNYITQPEQPTKDTDDALDAILGMVDEMLEPIVLPPGERPISFDSVTKAMPRLDVMDAIGKKFDIFKTGFKSKLDSMYSDKDPTKYEIEEYQRALVDQQNKKKHNLRRFTYDREGLESESGNVEQAEYEHKWFPEFATGSEVTQIYNVDNSTKSIDDENAEPSTHSKFVYDSGKLKSYEGNGIVKHKWQKP